MIAAALAAVGITPSLSAVERKAALALTLAKRENDRAAAVRALEEQRSQVNADAAKVAAKLEAEHLEFSLKLDRELSTVTRKKLIAAFRAWREQPSRAGALAIRKVVAEANAQSEHEQGARLDSFVISTSLIAALAEDENPNLVATFADPSNYAIGIVQAATHVLDAAEGAAPVSAVEEALKELEQAVDYRAKISGHYEATEEHCASFAALQEHATPAARAEAVHRATSKHGDARAKRLAAEYVAPLSVDSTGGVDVNGRQFAESVVRRGEIAHALVNVERGPAAAPVAMIDADGDDHLERIGSIDFTRLEQP